MITNTAPIHPTAGENDAKSSQRCWSESIPHGNAKQNSTIISAISSPNGGCAMKMRMVATVTDTPPTTSTGSVRARSTATSRPATRPATPARQPSPIETTLLAPSYQTTEPSSAA